MNRTNSTTTPAAGPLTEGGIINGVVILSSDLSLLIIQLLFVTLFSRFLGFLLKYIRQPRVIAEVIAGILLGPSAFGHIPGFTDIFFPAARMNIMNIIANVGLVLFLFIVGLELDVAILKRDLKKSILISFAGISLPFALGCAGSLYIYYFLIEDLPNAPPFSSVIIFIAVAMSITAFPVLARILTDTKLLLLPVGITSISAAAVDDATAWCLLALVVAIVSSKTLLNTLYIVLVLIGFCLVMLGIKLLVNRFVKVPEKITQNFAFAALILCFSAAWVTDLIGVHGMFGAFVAGLSLPRKHNFSIQLMEKIEDLTTFIFLPLYFAYSGLRTNLGTLSSGVAWGAVFLTIAIACLGKIIGVFIAAKLLGHSWREALTVGILMNTKGLVELIVLNIGLDSGIIDTRVFTIMVIMALVTTFMTTPIVSFLYPAKYRTNVTATAGDLPTDSTETELSPKTLYEENYMFRALLLILSPDVVPYAQKISKLLFGSYPNLVHICKAVMVTDRDSTLVNATRSSLDLSFAVISPLIQYFSKFDNINFSTERIIAMSDRLPAEIIEAVSAKELNFLLIPWLHSEEDDEFLSQIITYLLHGSPATLGLYIPCRALPVSGTSGKILVPFFGGENDIEAILMGINFSQTAWVVISRYSYSMDSAGSQEETDFLSTADEQVLDFVKVLVKDNANIEFAKKKCRSPSHVLEVLERDLALYSMAIVGRNSLDYFPEYSNERARVLGNVASFIEEQNIVNLMVLNRSKRRPKYHIMPPLQKDVDVIVKEL